MDTDTKDKLLINNYQHRLSSYSKDVYRLIIIQIIQLVQSSQPGQYTDLENALRVRVVPPSKATNRETLA